MHLLLIVLLLVVAFPIFRRIVGSLLSVVLWLVVVVTVCRFFG
jgi:hypothetical protein